MTMRMRGLLIVMLVLGALGAMGAPEVPAREEPEMEVGPEEVAGYYDTREWKAAGQFTPSLPPGPPTGAAQEGDAEVEGAEGGQPPRRRRGRRRKGGGRRRRKQRPYLPVLDTNTELPQEMQETPEGQERYGPEVNTETVEESFLGGSFGQDGNVEDGYSIAPFMEDDVLLEPHTAQTEDQEPPHKDKSYRRPYSRTKKQEQQDEEIDAGGLADIKTLLKQSGGLSLSEVLQRRNLSLADFLTGAHPAHDILEPSEIDHEEQSRDNDGYEEKPRRRLPSTNKSFRERVADAESGDDDSGEQNKIPVQREDLPRRRLPATRKTKYSTTVQYSTYATTERISFAPSHPRKSVSDNIIKRRLEKPTAIDDTTQVPTDFKNLIDFDDEISITTTFPPSTKSSRLSLKPRLRLPTVKAVPRRILKPDIPERANISDTKPNNKSRKHNIPVRAIPIDVKDLYGISSMNSTVKTAPKEKNDTIKTRRVYATTQVSTTSSQGSRSTKTKLLNVAATTELPASGPSAKEEILEFLTDTKGGERLTRVLAERNMSLGELVAQRERGSSQLHLADIFPNSSLSPSAPEPFLSKSMIAPISREIYPLKALLEGNMGKAPTIPSEDNYPPPSFVDLNKSSESEEHLGIVTLFDKFSEFGGLPKVLDSKDIKKDSDGSSYFTSVISVKPTDEVYREGRGGFQNSHKQVSPVFSSLPTYIKTEEILEARVVPNWDPPHHEHSMFLPDTAPAHGAAEAEEERLIVVAGSVGSARDGGGGLVEEGAGDEGLYGRLPVAVRSAIMVSSCIAGTSLLVFLTILVACRLRQRRRTMHYSSEGRPSQLASSRSISPILLGAGSSWDSSRRNSKPFQ